MRKTITYLAAVVFAVMVNNCLAVTLTMLSVTDSGNAGDSRDPSAFNRGAVNYNYYLDKHDVTNAQYTEFLNAKASVVDPFALFDNRMTTDDNGGIARSASAPFTYTTKPGMENKPVVFVSWFDALRFTNWLTNGQGSGDTESGSYLIAGGGPNSGTAAVPTAAERATWAGTSLHYLLPSVDEWYKAAYYKGGGTNAGYWSFATKSSSTPLVGPPGTGDMNVSGNGHFALPGPVYLSDVGAYLRPSPFGQMDMGGNVYQFTDSALDQSPNSIVQRGGSWSTGSPETAFNNYRNFPNIQTSSDDLGFRIAMVPEPGSMTLAAMALMSALFARRRGGRRRRLG